MSSSYEIETKFSLHPDTAVPDLASIDGVASVGQTHRFELSALYVDTQDLALTRQKITMRRRTGGKDAGWHIKLPATSAQAGRQEIQAELSEAPEPVLTQVVQVPAQLRDHLRPIIGDADLYVIAQVDNKREETELLDASGRAIIEFCDDRVSTQCFLPGGKPHSWREWEVELTENASDVKPLLKACERTLLAAGAKVADSPSKLLSALGHLAP